jgi:hypothetical protein
MNVRTFATIAALLAGAFLTGCVAQVGQPEEKTGTSKTSLDKDPPADPPPDPGNPSNTDDKNASDPGNNSTSGDNQGPQPLPWAASDTAPSSGSEQKKK